MRAVLGGEAKCQRHSSVFFLCGFILASGPRVIFFAFLFFGRAGFAFRWWRVAIDCNGNQLGFGRGQVKLNFFSTSFSCKVGFLSV